MKYTRILLVLIIGLFGTCHLTGQSPKHVLFIGNSYTYFWSLHLQVQALAESRGQDIKSRASFSGGVNLGQHWRGDRGLQSRQLVASGDYDVVIFQDHSRRAIDDPDSLLHYGTLWAEAAQEGGADVYFYVTWSREWDPYMQEPILKAYQQVARQNNARIIPIGPAWERAQQLRPNLRLYDPDGSHPSNIGTYLTACVIYGVLTGASPVGLTNRVELGAITEADFQFLNRMSAEDALFCQKVAEEILKTYRP